MLWWHHNVLIKDGANQRAGLWQCYCEGTTQESSRYIIHTTCHTHKPYFNILRNKWYTIRLKHSHKDCSVRSIGHFNTRYPSEETYLSLVPEVKREEVIDSSHLNSGKKNIGFFPLNVWEERAKFTVLPSLHCDAPGSSWATISQDQGHIPGDHSSSFGPHRSGSSVVFRTGKTAHQAITLTYIVHCCMVPIYQIHQTYSALRLL